MILTYPERVTEHKHRLHPKVPSAHLLILFPFQNFLFLCPAVAGLRVFKRLYFYVFNRLVLNGATNHPGANHVIEAGTNFKVYVCVSVCLFVDIFIGGGRICLSNLYVCLYICMYICMYTVTCASPTARR